MSMHTKQVVVRMDNDVWRDMLELKDSFTIK